MEQEPLCPLRPGRYCGLCFPGATGPDDCGLVYLVLSDPELRARLDDLWAAAARDWARPHDPGPSTPDRAVTSG